MTEDRDATKRATILRELRWALELLAQEPEEQLCVVGRFCPACEIAGGLEPWLELALNEYPGEFTNHQRQPLEELDAAVEAIPESEAECWNPQAIEGKSWEQARVQARSMLEAMGWPKGAPPAVQQVETGIWRQA
jgi:hypothetical protein